nr:iron-containing alcohol dehydrogenase [uncultured Oscillibacter sp.]
MNNFIFSYPTKVYFGRGCVREYLACLTRPYQTVMLAYGGGSVRKNGVYDEAAGILAAEGKTVVDFPGIMPNPTYRKVQEGAKLAREAGVDFILAVGGGSTIDCCKIVAAQAVQDADIWTMEMEKRDLPDHFLPMGAIVTVSGTGSEMNSGAVITHEEKKIKGGLMGAHSEFAMLDPAYTMSVPFRQVISGAFDTLSHAMETYFGKPQENNLSDDIGEAVMRSVIANMRALLADHESYNARSELMWASAMAENGILKIGKVTDFQCHQMEHQLGAYTDCNHGAGLAVLHPALYRRIYREGLPKFKRFAMAVWGIDPAGKSDEETAAAGVEALADFIREMGLPTSFHEMGIDAGTDFEAIANSTNITAGCCKKLTHEEILAIFNECR